jgi:hypothetical protein
MGKFIYSKVLLPIWEGIKNYYIGIIVSGVSSICFSVWRMLMSGLNWYSFFEALSLIFGVIFLILSIILVIQKSQNEIKKEVYNSNEDIKNAQKELCNLSKELLIINPQVLQYFHNIFNIKGKLIIFDEITIIVQKKKDNKILIFLTYFIYNTSLSIINAKFNEEHTKYRIKVLGGNPKQQIYTEENPIFYKLSPFLPFHHQRSITTYAIEIDFTDKMEIDVSGTLCLDYGDSNVELTSKISQVVKLQCQLLQQKNDKNEDIVVVIPIKLPVSPTN